MRKLLFIAVCLLSFASCTKKSSSTGSGSGSGTSGTGTDPVSTFNITVDGHNYNFSGSSKDFGYTAYTLGVNNCMTFNLSFISQSKVLAEISGIKLDATSAIGKYFDSGLVTVTDFGDGGKMYSNYGYAHQVTVNVTVSNGSQCKGTFDMNLDYNGSLHNIKGDFDYRK
jgi:hypothetical protein